MVSLVRTTPFIGQGTWNKQFQMLHCHYYCLLKVSNSIAEIRQICWLGLWDDTQATATTYDSPTQTDTEQDSEQKGRGGIESRDVVTQPLSNFVTSHFHNVYKTLHVRTHQFDARRSFLHHSPELLERLAALSKPRKGGLFLALRFRALKKKIHSISDKNQTSNTTPVSRFISY